MTNGLRDSIRLRQRAYRNPGDVLVLADLGKALLEEQRYVESLKWLERALKQDAMNTEVINCLITAYLKLGLLYSARKYCEKSLNISAGQPDVKEILGRLMKNPVTQEKRVTFYIPCYNVQDHIKKCIEGILSQSYRIEEIIVVDDGSNDNTLFIVSKYPVKIIQHKKNTGLSSARNTALRHAKGDYVASVDADVVPDKYWLENLMMEFTSDSIGGAGGKLLEQNTLTAVDRWRQVTMNQDWGKEWQVDLLALSGYSTVYRKECLEKVGGYNEKFRNNHEDIDLSYRVRMLNFKLAYRPQAIARHFRTDNLKSVLDTYWDWYKTTRGELQGLFNDFSSLLARIDYEFEESAAMVTKNIRQKRFHLIYLDILYGLRGVLKDILYVERYSKLPPDAVAQTFLASLAVLKYILKQKEGVSGELLKFIFDDLEDLTNSLKDKYRFYIPKLDAIFPPHASDSLKNSWHIKSMLPYADLGFIERVMKRCSTKLNFAPRIWKMAEVSARRIRHEEKYNPNKMRRFRAMLLNPPWRDGTHYGVRAGSRLPFTTDTDGSLIPDSIPFPFFMAYAASLLKEHKINTIIVDAVAEGLNNDEFLERVRGFLPDVVLIEAATASIENDLEWAVRLKDIDRDIKIVFAGTHVSALGSEFLEENPFVDYLILGEYEFVFLKLCQGLKKGRLSDKSEAPRTKVRGFLLSRNHNAFIPRVKTQGFLRRIKGVVYRGKHNRVVSNGRAQGVLRLDTLPLPERITLPVYNYNDTGSDMPSPTAFVMSSRGCPFGCTFCLWPQVLYGNRKYRVRNPISVVNEIEMLVREYGFKGIYFEDDTFNIGKERILKMCSEINKRGLKILWAVAARADTSDYETLKAMRGAGLSAIEFGVESAVQRLLDNCDKRLKINAVNKTVQECKKLGIKVHLTFALGLPGETKETIEETIAYALKLNPDSVQFFLITPFPGTKYYKMHEKKGLLETKDWNKYDGNKYAVMQGENLTSKELESARRKAQDAWSLHCESNKFNFSFKRNLRLRTKEYKGKIAIVDLLFMWPPRGGAAYDIATAASYLVREGFETEIFVPFYDKRFFRGSIANSSLFPAQQLQLQFKKKDFTPEIVSARLKEAVDCFEPDYVIIGDGWGFKPYLVEAFKEHKTFLRFYAYENLCLIGNGRFLKEDALCPYNFLDCREKCLECVNQLVLKYGGKDWFTYELLLSRALTKEFHGLLKKSLRQVHGIIVYNSMIAKMLSRFNKNVYVIPTGVDIKDYNVYFENNLGNSHKNILMVGRVDDRAKGLHILEMASEKLFKKRNDFTVTVTSSKEIKKPYIKSTGWLTPDRLPYLYQEADICVIPSIWPEPFGIVAVEAMSAGKPVIASRVGGLRDIIIDGRTGFLVEPGNVDELIVKIEILLDNPELRIRMGKEGRRRARKLYDWDTIIKKYYLPLFSGAKK